MINSQRYFVILLLTTILWIGESRISIAQSKIDQELARKYLGDTLNFKAMPDTFLLACIRPDLKYVKWELDERQLLTGNHSRSAYKKLYNYPIIETILPDTIVTEKYDTFPAFMGDPDLRKCQYITGQTQTGKTFIINNAHTTEIFLGHHIHNIFDAWLYMLSREIFWDTIYDGELLKTSAGVKYKQVDGGYLFRIYKALSTRPLTEGSEIYFIGDDMHIAFIERRVSRIDKNVWYMK